MFGFLGRQVFIAGFQQIFSIIAGVLILGFFVMAKFNKGFSGWCPRQPLFILHMFGGRDTDR